MLQRLRGPTPEDTDVGTRILRADAVGVALDMVYVLVAGLRLTHLFRSERVNRVRANGLVLYQRGTALGGLLLVGVIPAALALAARGNIGNPGSPGNPGNRGRARLPVPRRVQEVGRMMTASDAHARPPAVAPPAAGWLGARHAH